VKRVSGDSGKFVITMYLALCRVYLAKLTRQTDNNRQNSKKQAAKFKKNRRQKK
jgi:hypothetical protein